MLISKIEIRPYRESDQEEIDTLMKEIEQEFITPVFSNPSPNLQELSCLPGRFLLGCFDR